MKKVIITTASVSVLLLAGCAGSMQQMEMMQSQMSAMQMQMNTIEANAATAKDMASEALTNSSRNHMHMRKMFGHKMMK